MVLPENVDAFVRFKEQEGTHSSEVAVEVAAAVLYRKRKRYQR